MAMLRHSVDNGKIEIPGIIEVAGKKFRIIFPVQLTKKKESLLLEGVISAKFSNFELEVPSVMGGVVSKPSDQLKLHVHLWADHIFPTPLLLKKFLKAQ